MSFAEPSLIPYFAVGDIVEPRVRWPGVRQDAGTIVKIERIGTCVRYVVEYSDKRTQSFSFWMLRRCGRTLKMAG